MFGSAGSGGYGCIQQTFAESDQYGCAGCARRCGGTRNAGKRSDAAYGRFYMVFKELASRKKHLII